MNRIVSLWWPKWVLLALVIIVLLGSAIWVWNAEGDISRTDVIVSGATVLYTLLTGVLLSVTYFSNRPIITLYTERERGNIFLIITNGGNRPATNVRLNFPKEIIVEGRDLTATTGIFKYEIGAIPAGGRITTGFGFGTSLFPEDDDESRLAVKAREDSGVRDETSDHEQLPPDEVVEGHRTTLYQEGTVTYRDQINGQRYTHRIVLDARYLEGTTWFTSSVEREMPRHIKNLRDDVRDIRRNFHRNG